MTIPSRRAFLVVTGVGAAAVVVAGAGGVAAQVLRHPSTDRPGRGASSGATATTVPPRAPRLERALARENRLLATLAHAAATTPILAAQIAILRADHRAHAAALAELITAAGVTPTTASPPSPSASPGPAPAPVTDLVRWEKAAAAAVIADFATATGTEAAVLASIYASEQTHVAWLS